MTYFEALLAIRPREGKQPALTALAAALEDSWDHHTAYQGIFNPNNPAAGQCYPTSRVVQWFFLTCRVASGKVWTGAATEHHFWNMRETQRGSERFDLSWKQFPMGSAIKGFELISDDPSKDSPGTQDRCALLLKRVMAQLENRPSQDAAANHP